MLKNCQNPMYSFAIFLKSGNLATINKMYQKGNPKFGKQFVQSRQVVRSRHQITNPESMNPDLFENKGFDFK